MGIFLIFLSFLNIGVIWGEVEEGVYYCKEYERGELLEGGLGYGSCMEEKEVMGKKHYKVEVLGGKVREVEFRWGGIWWKEEYRYHEGGVSLIERRFFMDEKLRLKLETHEFYRGEEGGEYLRGVLRVQMNMPNGRRYQFRYRRKELRYMGGVIEEVRYYGVGEGLLMKVFYNGEGVSGYKIRKLGGKLDGQGFREEMYMGDDQWIYWYKEEGVVDMSVYGGLGKEVRFGFYTYEKGDDGGIESGVLEVYRSELGKMSLEGVFEEVLKTRRGSGGVVGLRILKRRGGFRRWKTVYFEGFGIGERVKMIKEYDFRGDLAKQEVYGEGFRGGVIETKRYNREGEEIVEEAE